MRSRFSTEKATVLAHINYREDIIENLSVKIDSDRKKVKEENSNSICRYEDQLSDQTWKSILRDFGAIILFLNIIARPIELMASITTPILEIKKRIEDVQLKFNAIINEEN